MATTTPNYGWPVPTSTDLVKDGAVAIESLGDAADATMATMVPKSIVDAKGDIIAATAADTVARLAVGTANQVLTVDSSTATGLKWATPAGGGGKVLQVVYASTGTYTTTTSTTFADTTLTATITPTLATSKILVFVSHNGVTKNAGDNNNIVRIKLLRGATDILLITDMGGYTGASNVATEGPSASYLDAPATTSATTYKTQFASNVAGQSSWIQNYMNANGNTKSTITLMEIGA
jgi:hypothetical protein